MVVDAAIFRAASRASKARDFMLAFRKPADAMSQHQAVAP
jgi:antirestriction protein ArdC